MKLVGGHLRILKLACRLDAIRESVLPSNNNISAVNVQFDTYVHNMIAPDHLLSGVGNFLVQAIFKTLENDESSSKLDILFFHDLQVNALGSHSMLCNVQNKVMNSISMSSIYALLCVIEQRLCTMIDSVDKDIFRFTTIYVDSSSELVAISFWWSQLYVDGTEA